MAHVVLIREVVSFTEAPGATYGTHEQMEREIAQRKYPIKLDREGYSYASQSEFKLVWYRIKKEAIPQFLLDIGIVNLNPKKLPKGFWGSLFLPRKVGVKLKLIPDHWYIGKAHLWAMLALRFVPFLKSAEPLNDGTKAKPLIEGQWKNDFFLGIIEDVERGFGEEL